MDEQIKKQIGELLFLAFEGEIGDSQIHLLNNLIKNHPERIRYTIDYLQVFSSLERSNTVADIKSFHVKNDTGPAYYMDVLLQMAEYEKTAPTIEIEKPTQQKEPVKMLKVEKSPRVINKPSLYTAIVSVAALVFILIYARIAPSPASSSACCRR